MYTNSQVTTEGGGGIYIEEKSDTFYGFSLRK